MARTEALAGASQGETIIAHDAESVPTAGHSSEERSRDIRRPVRTVFIQEIVPSYRLPFFEALAASPGVDLTVLSGVADAEDGFLNLADAESRFAWKRLDRRATRLKGARMVRLRSLIGQVWRVRPEVVISVGNKGFLQNHLLLWLKRVGGYRMYLLQHAHEYRAATRRFRILEWIYFRYYLLPLLDGVILYTEHERRRLVARGVSGRKLWFTNNTLDMASIREARDRLTQSEGARIRSELGIGDGPAIVFIGRLVEGKRVESLFDYFVRIRARVSDARLIVIGDGPGREVLRERAAAIEGVTFAGAVYDERRIAALMQPARAVFLPGYSGLSVNHAFAYGVPFVTLRSTEHKPEIDYVRHGENGYLLDPADVAHNVDVLCELMSDDVAFARMSRAASETAAGLTMEAMVNNVAGVITGRRP